MEPISIASATSTVLKTGTTVYTNRFSIQKYWKKLLAHLNLGKTNVIVVGRPNVGKSVLVAQLHGAARDLHYRLPPSSRQVDIEAIQIGEWTQLFRVLPGQSSNSRTLGEMEAFYNNNELEGVIYVTDYGYTTPRDSTIAETLITDDGITSIDLLREYNLKNELKDIASACQSIRQFHSITKKKIWFAIAVNKCDLFPNDINTAKLYYSVNGTSDFSKILKELQNNIGIANLTIKTLNVCAWDENFEWNQETTESNLPNRQAQKNMLLEFLDELIQLEKA